MKIQHQANPLHGEASDASLDDPDRSVITYIACRNHKHKTTHPNPKRVILMKIRKAIRKR